MASSGARDHRQNPPGTNPHVLFQASCLAKIHETKRSAVRAISGYFGLLRAKTFSKNCEPRKWNPVMTKSGSGLANHFHCLNTPVKHFRSRTCFLVPQLLPMDFKQAEHK